MLKLQQDSLFVAVESFQEPQILKSSLGGIICSEPWHRVKGEEKMAEATDGGLLLLRHWEVGLEDGHLESIDDSHHESCL